MLNSLKEWGCNVEEALERFVDDKDLYVLCMNLFVSDACFETLGRTIEEENYKDAFEAAHTLKGVAGNLSAEPIYVIIDTLTEKLRKNDFEGIKEEYEKILELRTSLRVILGNCA